MTSGAAKQVARDKSLNRVVQRNQLQLIIGGLTDGVILIEPDQTLAWANDAALAMHGVETLGELGTNVTEYRRNFQLAYRNKHSVDHGQYPIERVVGGEAFDDVVVEVTRAGSSTPEWVHRIRSLVINDADGMPDCLVLVIKDATDRYQAEERFQRTFSANPAPAIICRLSDLRYVKVNQGFLEMTGFRREEVLGRSTYEIDLLAKAERRKLAIERLSLGETIPQMEAELDLPDGTSRSVIVAGQPLEVGDEACLLFTFADLDRQKKAETALRHSEERFEKAFRASPVPTVLLKLDGLLFLAINDAFARGFRLCETDIVGRRMDEVDLWFDKDTMRQFEASAVQSGEIAAIEVCLKTSLGETLDCLVTGTSIEIGDGRCLLCTILDVSERRRTERDLTAAIDKVMADTSWFSRGLIEKLAEMRGLDRRGGLKGRSPVVAALTKREAQVLELICRGLNDARITDTIKIKPNTVRNHIAALYKKIDVHNRTEAVLWGHANGFSPEPDDI